MKDIIKQKGYCTGTWCEIPSPYTSNVIAKSGIDFIIIDMEHSVMDFETTQNMVMAAQCEKCRALIRVPELNESSILRGLDTGADGIVVPHVGSVNDLLKIVEFAKFPPLGNRGFNPFIRAGNYGEKNKNSFTQQNAKTFICVILEGKEAFDSIDEMVKVEGIDMYYIGQYDLSATLGCPGDISNKKIIDAMKKTARAATQAGKIAGCMVHDLRGAGNAKKMGIKVLVKGVDTGVMKNAYEEFVKGLEGKRDEVI